jgi:hypothetical protein
VAAGAAGKPVQLDPALAGKRCGGQPSSTIPFTSDTTATHHRLRQLLVHGGALDVELN